VLIHRTPYIGSRIPNKQISKQTLGFLHHLTQGYVSRIRENRIQMSEIVSCTTLWLSWCVNFKIRRVFKQVRKIILWPRRKLLTEKIKCLQRQILKFKLPEIPYSQASHTGASKLFWQRARNLLCFDWRSASLKITTCKPELLRYFLSTHNFKSGRDLQDFHAW
jgi:hypothetical protein